MLDTTERFVTVHQTYRGLEIDGKTAASIFTTKMDHVLVNRLNSCSQDDIVPNSTGMDVESGYNSYTRSLVSGRHTKVVKCGQLKRRRDRKASKGWDMHAYASPTSSPSRCCSTSSTRRFPHLQLQPARVHERS